MPPCLAKNSNDAHHVVLTLVIRAGCEEMKKMKIKEKWGTLLLLLPALVLVLTLEFIGNELTKAENPKRATVVFMVS